jgi:hypothetical protein
MLLKRNLTALWQVARTSNNVLLSCLLARFRLHLCDALPASSACGFVRSFLMGCRVDGGRQVDAGSQTMDRGSSVRKSERFGLRCCGLRVQRERVLLSGLAGPDKR